MVETNKLQEIKNYLSSYIKGQDHAINLIAILLINRERIEKLKSMPEEEIGYPKDELTPPNIMLIGPSGSGKTEIAKRIAEISDRFWFRMPCTVLSATGYVGKNVEDILTYAIESAIQKVKEQRRKQIIENELSKLLLQATKPTRVTNEYLKRLKQYIDVYRKFDKHPLLEEQISAIVPEPLTITNSKGENVYMGVSYQEVTDTVKNVIDKLVEGELIKQQESIQKEAVKLVESGIIMLDEIDKIVGGKLDNVSMYGVQRELLALVEGSVYYTKYGPVNTKNILFISAGAFQVVPLDKMLPELRGRFPIVVKLKPLTKETFIDILKNSKLSPLKKFQAIMKADGINVTFTDDAIEYLAECAMIMNKRKQLGARRLWELFDHHLVELYLLDKDTTVNREMLEQILEKKLNQEEESKTPYKEVPHVMYR